VTALEKRSSGERRWEKKSQVLPTQEVRMRRIMNWTGRIVFTVAVALALGFSGHQALGSSTAVDCPFCDTNEDCNVCCEYPPGGECIQNFVCVCL